MHRSEFQRPDVRTFGTIRPLLLLFVALKGGVAQLGERRVRNAKVEGSIPFSSTIFLGFARFRATVRSAQACAKEQSMNPEPRSNKDVASRPGSSVDRASAS